MRRLFAAALALTLAGCPQFLGDFQLGDASASCNDGAPDVTTDATEEDSGHEADSGSSGMTDSASGADASLPPPSCAPGGPGMTTCPAGTGTGSCCASLLVTGGSFDLTYTNDGGGPTGESSPATISSLRVDEYLVTVGRFRQFVNAVLPPDGGTGWTPPAGSGIHTHLNSGQGLLNSGPDGGYENTVGGWSTSWNSNIAPTNGNLACSPDGGPSYNTWTNTAGTASSESLPINCVNWYEAYAFCIWDGGFLPSEAEWEYTAAGGSRMLEYPWGSAAPGTNNQHAIYGDGAGNCYYPSGTLAACTGGGNIAPGGTAARGAGLWGQMDMAGEVWEWNLDWSASYVSTCSNCTDLTSGSDRVVRGGDYGNPTSVLLPMVRGGGNLPSSRYSWFGFRCARTP